MQLRHLAICFVFVALPACSDRMPPVDTASSNAAASSGNAQTQAITRVGDVSIRASVIQTSMLAESVAHQYGIARDPKTVLLMVGVRQGPDASATALPATITATATDLRGGGQAVAMHEVKTGDLVDYVGTITTTLPDTLRFDIRVVRANGATSTMQLSKDFYPQ